MKLLREMIRKLIIEVYELSDKEKAFAARTVSHDGSSEARALGLQSKKQIIKDREALHHYQEKLKSTPQGKKLIRQFMNGKDITIMHAINYEGYASFRGFKSLNNRLGRKKPFQSWVGKFGRSGKDVLSVVASDRPLGTSFNTGVSNEGAARGFGFIMKGYPVYISESDVMSQTLGALPAGLVKHQEQSGVAKRPGEQAWMGITEPDFGWAGEVLLDNWTVIGTYMDVSGNATLKLFESLASDSVSMSKPLPMYIYNNGTFVGIIENEQSLAQVRKKIFGF